jgi:hypothetical protein
MSDLIDSASFFFEQGVKEITPDVLQATTRSIPTDREVKAVKDLLEKNKLLSQLIARSYLPEGEGIRSILTGDQDGIRELLMEVEILTEEEAKNSRFDVDTHPQGSPPFVGRIEEDPFPDTPEILIWKIPLPTRHEELTDEQLNSWLATPPDSEPWEPYHISIWIPYTC